MFIFQKNFEFKNELTAFAPDRMVVTTPRPRGPEQAGAKLVTIPAFWVSPKSADTFTLGNVEIYFQDIPLPSTFEDIMFEAGHYEIPEFRGWGRETYGRHVSHNASMIMGPQKLWSHGFSNILEDVKFLTEVHETVPQGGMPEGFTGWFKFSKRRQN